MSHSIFFFYGRLSGAPAACVMKRESLRINASEVSRPPRCVTTTRPTAGLAILPQGENRIREIQPVPAISFFGESFAMKRRPGFSCNLGGVVLMRLVLHVLRATADSTKPVYAHAELHSCRFARRELRWRRRKLRVYGIHASARSRMRGDMNRKLRRNELKERRKK